MPTERLADVFVWLGPTLVVGGLLQIAAVELGLPWTAQREETSTTEAAGISDGCVVWPRYGTATVLRTEPRSDSSRVLAEERGYPLSAIAVGPESQGWYPLRVDAKTVRWAWRGSIKAHRGDCSRVTHWSLLTLKDDATIVSVFGERLYQRSEIPDFGTPSAPFIGKMGRDGRWILILPKREGYLKYTAKSDAVVILAE